MKTRYLASLLMLVAAATFVCSTAAADPYPDELLKFYQMPLNNGFTPYFPISGSNPAGSTYGTVLSTAIFPGHDELSTAHRTSPATPWQGIFMADDFADYAGTPISHVRWWGSYLQGEPDTAGLGVRRFLISFEHNVPAMPDPTNPNEVIPSHPDPFNPENLHQIVTFTPGIAPPLPGTFTEKPIPTPTGPVLPPERLFEYNAELHLDKWFKEKKATSEANNVYWLKIVALVDDYIPEEQGIQWGWHNRDWSIKNDLAAKPGDTPDGAERSLTAGLPGGEFPPLWHFEDDAVTGGVVVGQPLATMPNMPQFVEQFNMVETYYQRPWDLPTNLPGQYSKDLAFELYTRIPEPTSIGLMSLAVLAFAAVRRRRVL